MEKDAAGSLSRASPAVSSSVPPVSSIPQPAPSPTLAAVPVPKPMKEAPDVGERAERQMFTVDLRSGETTIVSWKKLLRESGLGNGEAFGSIENKPVSEAGPVAGVRPGGEDLKHTLQPSNCFSTVIEKIERLYMGKESSDEEELEVPDDEQYDTEDSFIDDTELDEYFQVDKMSTKHNGYFVNRGKLEWIEPSSLPNPETKKPRRKDSAEIQNEMNHEHVPNEHANRLNMKIKAAARTAPLVAKKFTPAKVVASLDEHYQDGKLLKAKHNSSQIIEKKRSADLATNLDVPPSTKVPNKAISSPKVELKEFSKNKSISSKGIYKSNSTNEPLEATYQTSREKAAVSQAEPQAKKLFNSERDIDQLHKVQRKDRYEACEFSQMTSSMTPYPIQTIQPFPHRVSEVTVRPKGTILERAIRDLEKIVALSRPPNGEVQEVEPSVQGVRRRLPQEIKQKLAKVARLAASQSKISEEELIDRLMGFIGHLVHRKTLKRNMREMVELGLCAKQQKADQFLQIKEEILEMVKSRVSNLKSKVSVQQDGSADDFQDVVSTDERRALTGKYSMDAALEEKLCDLYDLYVEGMDEDKGPQSRKLYVEFAELWPTGYMDNLGIKDAINRAKKRRRIKLQVRNEERIERKKLSLALKPDERSLIAQPQTGQDRHAVPSPQVPRLLDKPSSNSTLPSQTKLNDPTSYRTDSTLHYGYEHQEKGRGNAAAIVSDGGNRAPTADMRKKMKRKSEFEGDSRGHPQKMQARPAKVRPSSFRPGDDTNPSLQQSKPIVQMPAAPT